MIGKAKYLGKMRHLTPIVFTKEDLEVIDNVRIVKFQYIRYSGSDIEIDFFDPDYTNKITLDIKRIDYKLKDEIIKKKF